MDWSIDAPQNVKDDLDTLFRDAVDAAAKILANSETFAPFMLVIDHSGRRAMRVGEQGTPGADVLAITRTLQQDADRANLRARITVIDVTVSAPFHGDAIKTMFEHSTGLTIDMLVPYAMTSDNLEINLDATDAVTGTRRLWA